MSSRAKTRDRREHGSLDIVREEAMAFAKIGLYRYRFDGTVVFMDQGALRIFELEDRFPSPADAAGQSLGELFVYTTPVEAMRREIQQKGALHDREWSFQTLKGTLKWVMEDAYLVREEESGEQVIQVVCRDITEEKSARWALLESERRCCELVDTFPFSLAIFQDGKIVYANPATARMLGNESPAEIIGRDIHAGVAESEKERLRTYARRRLDGAPDVPTHYESVLRRENGTEFPAEIYMERILFEGRPALQALVIDITERQKAQQDLRASEERYRDILESIQEGYYEVDLKGNLTFFNPALCAVLGYTAEELRGLNYRHYYPDAAAARRAYVTFQQVYETGQAAQLVDWRVRRKDGTEASLEVSISPMHDAEGKPAGFHGIARDVTRRKLAEQKREEAEARYREIFENANDMLYTHDLSGKVTSVNRVALELTGYTSEEVLGRNVMELLAPECRAKAAQMIARKLQREESASRYESVLLQKQGARVPVEVSTRLIYENGTPVGIQGSARDITERKRAEEERRHLEAQVIHTQKLESLGVLAGGIAHDFNNLLVGILGNAGLALTRLEQGTPAHAYVHKIELAAQRAAQLTNQMLAYAGKGTFVIRPVHLPMLAREMSPLLTASIAKTASLRYDFEADLPLIRGDIAQLHQVIMNLVTNASDAIGDQPGTITIRAYTAELDEESLAETYLHDRLEPGQFVCLEVQDSGCGMNQETLSRIFDPFFSTKFAGRGLGLASVLGIVRAHKGAIGLESSPGKGATFRVYFPAVAHIAAAEAAAESVTADDVGDWRASGLILIVDDEKPVREVARAILEHRGFRTLLATDGREAIRLFEEHCGEITLVLLDLTMPELDGIEVLRQLHGMRSNVPVILSSGYTRQDAIGQNGDEGAAAFIQKPYLPHELVRTVRDVLAAKVGT